MNILIINIWDTIETTGGAEKIFCEMSNELVSRDHIVTALCVDRNEGKPKFYVDPRVKFLNAGLVKLPWYYSKTVRNIRCWTPFAKKRREIRAKYNAQALAYRINKVVDINDIDVVVSFQPQSAYSVIEYLNFKKTVITMTHNNVELTYSSLPDQVKKVLQKHSLIHVYLKQFREDVKLYLPKADICVIPNSVPQVDYESNLKCKTIICIGRVIPSKRQDLLINAFALIADKYYDWNVVFFGDVKVCPQYFQYLEDLIEKLKLTSKVKFCGVTLNPYVELEKASIFAFPSESEGWGLALTEAMSVGLPCVGCKDCSSVNSLIRNRENGLLCEPNSNSFAASLSYLIGSYDLRVQLGQVARNDMKQYAKKVIWDEWEMLLCNLRK